MHTACHERYRESFITDGYSLRMRVSYERTADYKLADTSGQNRSQEATSFGGHSSFGRGLCVDHLSVSVASVGIHCPSTGNCE